MSEFTAHQFYRITYFEDSPISDSDFRYRIPRFKCPECGSDSVTSRFAFPHADPAVVLDKHELLLMAGRNPRKAPDEEIIRCVDRLRAHFKLPITAGSSLGPRRIKVATKAKVDFDALPFQSGLFVRRVAAERLKKEGFIFTWVPADAYGKHAADADFVQLVVPVAGRAYLPSSLSFCPRCFRYSPHERLQTVLYDTDAIHQLPFFATLEDGVFVLAASFVKAASQDRDSGLVEGDTLLGVPVRPGPAPSVPGFPSTNVVVEAYSQSSAPTTNQGAAPLQTGPQRELDRAFAEAWLERVRGFLGKVRSKGGRASFALGDSVKGGASDQSDVPQPLAVLLQACSQKLSFRYDLEPQRERVSGGLKLDRRLLKRQMTDCVKWATETWIAEDPDEKELWLNSFPFAGLLNGDYLGLLNWKTESNPPVIYLSHEDSSQVIAPDLASFLQAWAELCFIGPELESLSDFVDASTGYLRSDTRTAEDLRNLFSEQK